MYLVHAEDLEGKREGNGGGKFAGRVAHITVSVSRPSNSILEKVIDLSFELSPKIYLRILYRLYFIYIYIYLAYFNSNNTFHHYSRMYWLSIWDWTMA